MEETALAELHFCHTEVVNWCQRSTATTVAYLLTFLIPILQPSRLKYSLCLEEMDGLCWTDHIPTLFVGICVLKGKYCFEAILCHSIPVAINFTVKEEVPHVGVFIFTPSLDTHCDSPVCAKFWYLPPVSHSSHWHWQRGGVVSSGGPVPSSANSLPLFFNRWPAWSALSSSFCRFWQAASVNFGSSGRRSFQDQLWLQCVHSRRHPILKLEAADWLPRSVSSVTHYDMFSLSRKWKFRHT